MENNTQVIEVRTNLSPMKMTDWLVMLLVMAIPIVNIVLLIIWATSTDVNQSKKTYCQASLAMMAIGIVLYFLFFAAFFSNIMNNL